MTYAENYSHRAVGIGERAGRFVRAVAGGKLLSMSPMEYSERVMGDKLTARTLLGSVAATGGFMIPEDLSSEIIDLLRPRTVVRRAGPHIIPMPHGNMSFPRINVGAKASYVGEAQPALVGDEAFGQVRLSSRKLMARVGVSNDLIRFASPQADTVIRDEMVKQLAVAEDQAFLRGSGSIFTPKGLRYWAPAANVNAMTGSPTITTALADMTSMVTLLMNAYVSMIKPTWIVSQRTWNFFYDARDSVGGFLFRNEMDRGMFRNYPMFWSQNVPQNLSGTTTEVYLVDMDQAMIGEFPGLIIDASQEATFTPDGTNLVSAFDNDLTVIRVIAQHDFAMRQDAAVAVLTGVTWQ
jgi:HK97 family phage major capsid protein